MALRIGTGLSLPVEAVTEKLAFLGRTGSGKTYAAQKLAEEMEAADAQFVALDPVGKWWSLRLAADGKKPGIPIPVFGGLHGDIPLEHTAGKLIADVIVDRGVSAVLDVSQFESDAQKNRFARDFGDRFFYRKKAEPSAVHLFLEEAQEFVPQNLMGDNDREVLHVFTRIWKLGRNFGIGGSLITQRPQEVNKKVLNLTEVLFAFQLTGTHERASVAKWIEEKGLDLDVEALLPKLRQGHPHIWSPVLLNLSKTVQIGAKWTYDASSTPKVGKRAVVKTLAPIDLAKLEQDMAATIERAKQDDPRALRQQVRELERKLAAKIPTPRPGKAEIKKVEVPIFAKATVRNLTKLMPLLLKLGPATAELAAEIRSALDRAGNMQVTMTGRTDATGQIVLPPIVARTFTSASNRSLSDPKNLYGERTHALTENGKQLPQGEKLMLTAVAQTTDGQATKQQLTVVTGYKRSTRDAYLARLSQKGYVQLRRQDVLLTTEGQHVLGDTFEPLPTGHALATHWIAELPEGESKILALLIAHGAQTADVISEQTGYKRSTRDAYLARLKARQLITGSGRDGYAASPHLRD